MAPRQQLHELLKAITTNVYFQPPSNIQMRYPCIIYSLDGERSEYAGNRPYLHADRYQVTVIDRNPDSDIRDAVRDLPFCTFDRWYAADDLNHYVFNIFF